MIEVVLAASADRLKSLLVANAHGSLARADGLAAVALCQDADVGVHLARAEGGEDAEAAARVAALRGGPGSAWSAPLEGLPDGWVGAVACAAGPRPVTVRRRA